MAQQRRSQCRVRPAVIGAVVVVMIQSATGGAQKVRGGRSSCRSSSSCSWPTWKRTRSPVKSRFPSGQPRIWKVGVASCRVGRKDIADLMSSSCRSTAGTFLQQNGRISWRSARQNRRSGRTQTDVGALWNMFVYTVPGISSFWGDQVMKIK